MKGAIGKITFLTVQRTQMLNCSKNYFLTAPNLFFTILDILKVAISFGYIALSKNLAAISGHP